MKKRFHAWRFQRKINRNYADMGLPEELRAVFTGKVTLWTEAQFAAWYARHYSQPNK